ncbi:interferon-induced protein 44-like, partial [Clarias magur]
FNPMSPLTAGDPGYISNPALSDRAHCLVSVMSARSVNLCCNSTAMKLRSIWDRASDVGIPHVVIMTNVDKVCPLVKEDLKAIYKSRSVKEK